ncbi:glycosyltransferase family 4 protein [Paraurantiacibacter namhicola]|uniref:Lipopolysaccharide core biosynthesis protein RfaG n=1 Tax=Paraurantiacibacter namhicola TaxID=645517 RepID=A0A1C7D8L5_9SPHN|nr:glycosyltransferase family 4 protein [Paraurantiacibacter namhicola]ANU07633.1 Lipopolysaccharide core biosynthesis protein RfaG [Paraurantiacibacter namhicola]
MAGERETSVAKQAIAVFHPGTQHSWQTARALHELDRLAFYATSILRQPGQWPYVLEGLPGALGRTFAAEFRRFDAAGLAGKLDDDQLRVGGKTEWVERLTARLGLARLAERIDHWGNGHWQGRLADDIHSDRQFALWGYNNSADVAFALGKQAGRTAILDRTIGDPRAYNRDMAMLETSYGDWFLNPGKQASDREIDRAVAEHELADHILVGCEFAKETLAEFEGPAVAAKTRVLEYGFDAAHFAALPTPSPAPKGAPVRFLFVGLGIPRKGIHHVLEAIARLPANEASLTVVGAMGVPERMLASYRERVHFTGSLPRNQIPEIMAQHDVLLFPTYFEGGGIVLYEALVSGMALIQSDRAAHAVTPDTGIMLQRPDTDLLVDAMQAAISDRDRLAHWRSNAQAAAGRYTFGAYRGRMAQFLQDAGI